MREEIIEEIEGVKSREGTRGKGGDGERKEKRKRERDR